MLSTFSQNHYSQLDFLCFLQEVAKDTVPVRPLVSNYLYGQFYRDRPASVSHCSLSENVEKSDCFSAAVFISVKKNWLL